MQNRIHGPVCISILAYIRLDKLKPPIAPQVGNIFESTCEQVVDTDDLVAVLNEGIAEMASEKTRPSCYENLHCPPPRDGAFKKPLSFSKRHQ